MWQTTGTLQIEPFEGEDDPRQPFDRDGDDGKCVKNSCKFFLNFQPMGGWGAK